MEFNFAYLFIWFAFFPICILVHELGHAFFITLWGWKVTNIQVGWGDTLIKIGKLSVNKMFFIGGLCSYERPDHVSKIKKAFVHLGGVFFNALFIGVLYWLSFFFKTEYIGYLNFMNSLLILICLIPCNDPRGYPSDGKQFLRLLRKETA